MNVIHAYIRDSFHNNMDADSKTDNQNLFITYPYLHYGP